MHSDYEACKEHLNAFKKSHCKVTSFFYRGPLFAAPFVSLVAGCFLNLRYRIIDFFLANARFEISVLALLEPGINFSRATVNIFSKNDYFETKTICGGYMSAKQLNVCGKLQAKVCSDHCSLPETFHVAEGSSGAILSSMISQEFILSKL